MLIIYCHVIGENWKIHPWASVVIGEGDHLSLRLNFSLNKKNNFNNPPPTMCDNSRRVSPISLITGIVLWSLELWSYATLIVF